MDVKNHIIAVRHLTINNVTNIAAVVNSCQGRIHDILMNSSDKFNECLVYAFSCLANHCLSLIYVYTGLLMSR